MTLDEVVLRANLGSQIVPGHVVVGQFGPGRAQSLVAISQTLDKLVVHELSSLLSGGANIRDQDTLSPSSELVYYIAIKDVIRSVAVRTIMATMAPCNDGDSKTIKAPQEESNEQLVKLVIDEQVMSQDLLLVGCSNSVLVYDLHHKSNLFSVTMATAISSITNDPPLNLFDTLEATNSKLTICAGSQKIYALKFDLGIRSLERQHEFGGYKVELTSERSTTGDTITCLIQGFLGGAFGDLVVAGTLEHKIRAFPLDPFDLNIQTCRLTIEESSQVNCLCPINTINEIQIQNQNEPSQATDEPYTSSTTAKMLPSVNEIRPERQEAREQMNYFAYGLENGFIGVYQLFQQKSKGELNNESRLSTERLWRHKCKCSPVALLMFDLNGDGLDELLVGFKNSRIEARSPFTGQLLATTRLFKSDTLAGLVAATAGDGPKSGPLLLACATSGAMNGYRATIRKPRRPLQGYGGVQDSSSSPDELLELVAGTNLKTIEEEQTDVSMTMVRDDLNIELQSDMTTASRCDARQSHELLLRLNGLLTQQLELERRACQLYHKHLCGSKSPSPHGGGGSGDSIISINHRWDFDLDSLSLRLSIVIGLNQSSESQVRLIELGDESRNFVENGHLLVNSDEFNWLGNENHSSTRTKTKHRLVVAVPLRARRNASAQLQLKVFSESSPNFATSAEIKSQQQKLSVVHSAPIDVPTFAMLVPAHLEASIGYNKPAIKMTFRLVDWVGATEILDWLHDSSLCLRFGRLIESHQGSRNLLEAEQGSNNEDHLGKAQIMMDDSGGFRLNLLDLRETSSRAQHELHPKLVQPSNNAASPPDLGRTLRIGYSNAGDSGATLTLECDSSDLMAEIVQSLVIDRLHLEISTCLELSREWTKLDAVRDELNRLVRESRQVEESEKRIQSELYESADCTQNLMQQLAIANELEEYSVAKELLSELYMMLCGAQNSARGQCLNSKSRLQLSKQVESLRLRLDFLTGKS